MDLQHHPAYLQSAEHLAREVFIKEAPLEFEIHSDQYLQILRPIYGLQDAVEYWHITLDKYHREELDMEVFKAIQLSTTYSRKASPEVYVGHT